MYNWGQESGYSAKRLGIQSKEEKKEEKKEG
jgi:hypothetical protein